uniref:Uncharacterized protein n=1 Tax=Urocitellus parryii TaxID=9999 RepID=A0A8D2KNM6_UROPR
MMCIHPPRQALHCRTAPDFLPWPPQALLRTLLVSCGLVVFPLNRSSEDTWRGCFMSPSLLAILTSTLIAHEREQSYH